MRHPACERGVRIETMMRLQALHGTKVTPRANAGCGLKRSVAKWVCRTESVTPRANAGCGLKLLRHRMRHGCIRVTPRANAGCGLKLSGKTLIPPLSRHPACERGVRIE